MRKRSEHFELVILGFAIAIYFFFHLIWGNLLYGAIKAWAEKNVGVREADLIAGLQQQMVPLDLLPKLSPFIRRVCSGYAPDRGVLRTQSV